MAISAQDVKRLRDATGVGMMDCKKALQEADGDFDRAVEVLRKKGQKVAAKRADREADEGLVVTAITDDHRTAAIAEVNCETDFVARNDDFAQFAHRIAEIILEERPEDLDALDALAYDEDGTTVERATTDLTGKIGEKIEVRRFQIVEAQDEGQIVSYIHPGSRLGVLVDVKAEAGQNGALEDTGRDVAMQVAALDPIATFREEVPENVQEKEKEIAHEAAQNENKPEHVMKQIVNGKLERFFKDNVLVEQPFVKDASKTVKQVLSEAGVEIKRFVRFALGD